MRDSRRKQSASKKAIPAAVVVAAVCAVVAAVYWPALSAKALSFDDEQYLTKNLLVQNPSWASAKRFLTEVSKPSTVMGYYQPLTMISLMFDYALGGRQNNLVPFHRTSLALHVANTAMITVLLYLLFGQIWVAACVGLLFGVHPMTVEPVPWVGERKTLLAAFFSLWSLIFYLLFTIYYSKATSNKRQAAKFYIGSFAMYFLAMMSKPISTPLPFVMLLMDYWPLRRLNRRAIFEKIPFFVLCGVFAVITYVSQSHSASVKLPGKFGLWRIPLILCHNIIFYLYKMVWPVRLSSHYPFPEPLNLSQPMVLAGVIGTFILIPLLLISLRWTRAALTGWLMFFIAILPAMQIIGFSNVIASDKFAYLPSVGLLMILAAFLVWLKKSRFLTLWKAAVVIILVLVCVESVATQQYLDYWQDTIKFHERMLALTPDAGPVHYNIAVELAARGRVDEAISHYRRAIELMPDPSAAHYNLAVELARKGKIDEAIAHYRKVIELKPHSTDAYNNLGVILESRGNLSEAISLYRRVLQVEPDNFRAHYNLGNAMERQGDLKEAINCYLRAVRIEPNSAEIYNNLGYAYGRLNLWQKAAEAFGRAIRIKPNDAGAHYNLGAAYVVAGDSNSALREYEILKKLNSGQAKTLFNLIHK